MILQDAAHPQPGGILQGIQCDPFAVEIGRLLDAAAGSFDHILMAKTAMRKDWDCVVVAAFVARDQIADQG